MSDKLLYNKFDEQIFMGNGIRSMAACYAVHKLVDETLEAISGLQQEGLYGFEPDQESIDDAQDIIHTNVKQIVLALTGKKLSKKFLKGI